MRKKALSQREKEFCRGFALCGNYKEAALDAGYAKNPEGQGRRLLCREDIAAEIQSVCKSLEQTAYCLAKIGYRRLAFGSIADAVRLLYMDSPSGEDLKNMDLFSVSEIKIPKDGAMEIKFFDRLKALEKLELGASSAESGAGSLFDALRTGAQALAQRGEKVED